MKFFAIWGLASCFCIIPNSILAREVTFSEDSNLLVNPQFVLGEYSRARDLLEKGIDLYESGNFVSASNLWLQSVDLFAKKKDILGEALGLNNLALSYQQQGDLDRSKIKLDKSFLLLEKENIVKNSVYWSILGKNTNTLGNWYWLNGKTELALKSWEEADRYYLKAADETGVVITKINQAKALQALGLNIKAVSILESVALSLEEKPDSLLKNKSIRYLAEGLRNIGQLTDSEKILENSISLVKSRSQKSLFWLELGNTYRQEKERLLAIGKLKEALLYEEKTLKAYENSAQFADYNFTKLSAQLNQLNTLIELGKITESLKLSSEIFDRTINLAPSRPHINAKLSLANSLTCLEYPNKINLLCKNNPDISTIKNIEIKSITVVEKAIADARKIQDTITEAKAMGQLANIYELEQNFSLAKTLTEKALLLLEGKQADEIVYTLEWQLARTLKQQGKDRQALLAYSRSLEALEKIRANILGIDNRIQFSFRDKVEPVYREFVDLLLTTQPSQENLKKAIEIIDSLQLAELENYLGCNISQLINLKDTEIDNTAARVYPIILSERLSTIIEIPGRGFFYREIQLPSSQIKTSLKSLQNNLTTPGNTPEVLKEAQQIYQWLISPLESLLTENPQIKTLVFVPDSEFRNIPLSILYDGKEYLLQKDYALAVAPRLKLFAPRISKEPLKILTGGVEISQNIEGIEFPIIEQIQQELSQISETINTSKPLLNEQFTKANIEQQLKTGDFSAIHWKTHGIFSSDPNETFLVAYQESIKANDLQNLVQTAIRNRVEPLKLLVLSACETALGDNRAVLGLAGLTVKTGAYSTLSTLWRANDRATTILMTKFYQQLSLPGKTKAQALKEAQLYLIEEQGYFAPYYWGTYLLVGNWL